MRLKRRITERFFSVETRAASVVLLLAVASDARADTQGYEERLVDWALQKLGRERETAAESKRVGEIFIVTEEIVAESDPYPKLMNLPHWKTRDVVVRRELLFKEGDGWSEDRRAETERNLRGLSIFAMAKVVPLKAEQADVVDVLVVTKDLWSIRFNQQLSVVGPLVRLYRARPRESNLLGFGKTLSLDFVYRRDTLTFGEIYEDPRLFGLPLALSQSAAVIFNRGTNRAEGSRGSLAFGRPLYNLNQQFAWTVGGAWNVQRARIFRGANILELPYPEEGSAETVPLVYDARTLSAAAVATYRVGDHYKREFSGGFGGYKREYRAPYVLQEDRRAWLAANFLPRSEDAVYLYGAARLFEGRFVVMRNVYTFAISEDVQVGPSVYAQARYASPLLGSPTHFLETGLRARYRLHYRDNLASFTASGSARYTPAGDPLLGDRWVDQSLVLQAEEVTAPVGPGRFVLRALWWRREKPLSVPFLQLGGDSGLRGVGAEALRGRNQLLFNFEYRTRPLEFKTLHGGLVFFYDAGSAYDTSPKVVHTVGVGLRLLFPQFDVQTFRLDFGWAINGPATPLLDRFSANFGQVTDARPAALEAPLD